MTNPFVHVELQTRDLPNAKDFYARLFDWKLQDLPMPQSGSYTIIDVGGGTGGGMFANPDPRESPRWMAYVGVDDIRAMTEKARQLGATICVDVTEVGDFGWMSVFTDPTGATLALWQPKQPQNQG